MPEAVMTYAGAPSTAEGAITNVGAGGIITGATLTLGIGRWEISVVASWGAAAGTANNIQLKVVQGTPAVTSLYPLALSGPANGSPVVNEEVVIQVFLGTAATPNNTATVSVNAILADATGAYQITLIARPLAV